MSKKIKENQSDRVEKTNTKESNNEETEKQMT